MKIGISTACFYPRVNTEDTFEIIKSLGFDTCEVFLECEFETGYLYIEGLKKKIDSLNLNVYSIHPFSAFEPFIFDKYPRRKYEMEKRFEDTCKACSLLGAKYYIFHGISNTGTAVDIDYIAQGMDRLLSIAEGYGVGLAWENVSWCRSSSPEFINDIKSRMKRRINFNLDLKQAVRSGFSPYDYLKVYGKDLVNVHINDSNEKSSCLLPGKGNSDFKRLISYVKDIDESIPFIIEVYSENYDEYEQLKISKEYLEKIEKL